MKIFMLVAPTSIGSIMSGRGTLAKTSCMFGKLLVDRLLKVKVEAVRKSL